MKTIYKRLIGIFCVLTLVSSYVPISYADNDYTGVHKDYTNCYGSENLCEYHNRGTNDRLNYDCLVDDCSSFGVAETGYPVKSTNYTIIDSDLDTEGIDRIVVRKIGNGGGIDCDGIASDRHAVIVPNDPIGGIGVGKGRVYFQYRVKHSDYYHDLIAGYSPGKEVDSVKYGYNITINNSRDARLGNHIHYPARITNANVNNTPDYVDPLDETQDTSWLFKLVGGLSNSVSVYDTHTQQDNQDPIYRPFSAGQYVPDGERTPNLDNYPDNCYTASIHDFPSNSGIGDTLDTNLFKDENLNWVATYHGDPNYYAYRHSNNYYHGAHEFYIKFPATLKRRGYKFNTIYSTSGKTNNIAFDTANTGQTHLGPTLTDTSVDFIIDTNACGITDFGKTNLFERSVIRPTIVPIEYTQIYKRGNTNSNEGNKQENCYFDGSYNYKPENTFTGRSYKVTADANGGKFSDNKTKIEETGNLKFKDWSQENAKGDFIGTRVAGLGYTKLTSTDGAKLDVTANWKSAEYTAPTPTREGYEFDGWERTDSSDDVTVDEDEGKVTVKPSTENCNVVLKAKWKPMYNEVYVLTIPDECSTKKDITGAGKELNTKSSNKTSNKNEARKWVNPTNYKQGSAQKLWNARADKGTGANKADKWVVPGYHFNPYDTDSAKMAGNWCNRDPLVKPRDSVGKFGANYTASGLNNSDDDKRKVTSWTDDKDDNDKTVVKVTGSGPLEVWFYTTVAANSYKITYKKNQPENNFDFQVEGKVDDQTAKFDRWLFLRDGGYSCVGYELVGWSAVPGTYEEQIESGKAILVDDYDCPESISDAKKKNMDLGLYVRNIGGWTSKYDSDTGKYVSTDDVTLYAMWKPLHYKVIYTKGTPTTAKGSDVFADSHSSVYGSTTTAEKYYPEWNKKSNLFNNTPQLKNTEVENKTPHFTNEGYYIDYWTVTDIKGTREKSYDTTGKKYKTGTGYTSDNKSTSATKTFLNLCAPKKDDCVVTLEAHWAPLRYRVQYNNDTTVPIETTTNPVDRGYKFSTSALKTKYREYGKTYSIDAYSPTRSNRYGASRFLGYCFGEGDISKTPTYVVQGKSPLFYTLLKEMKKNYTATDWKGKTIRLDATFNITGGYDTTMTLSPITVDKSECHDTVKTNKGLSYKDYYKYIQNGAIQFFNLYAVWDDCPGIEPIDTEQLREDTILDYSASTEGYGRLTRSGSDLEYKILMLKANKDSIWDREDDVSMFTKDNALKEHYYLANFDALKMSEADNVHSYELRYTLVDGNGNTYSTSRKIFSGKFYDIMVHGQGDVVQFNH